MRERIQELQSGLDGSETRRPVDELNHGGLLEPGWGLGYAYELGKYMTYVICQICCGFALSGEIQIASSDGQFLAGSPTPAATPRTVTPKQPRRLWRLRSSLCGDNETTNKRRRVDAPTPSIPSPPNMANPGGSGEKFDNTYHQNFVCMLQVSCIISIYLECSWSVMNF